ncbi:hypothetical protein JTE90_016546, partial [Oedothorax gibbosus]
MAIKELFILLAYTITCTMPRNNQPDEAGECTRNCWCRQDELTCNTPDTLVSIPILSSEAELLIVKKITIQSSGLQLISPKAFAFTRKLKE